MSKHVLDRPRVMSNALLRRGLAIQRNAMPRKASLTLQRRRRKAASSLRAARFLRIERRTATDN